MIHPVWTSCLCWCCIVLCAPGGDIVVQTSWRPDGSTGLLHYHRHVVRWMHICWYSSPHTDWHAIFPRNLSVLVYFPPSISVLTNPALQRFDCCTWYVSEHPHFKFITYDPYPLPIWSKVHACQTYQLSHHKKGK